MKNSGTRAWAFVFGCSLTATLAGCSGSSSQADSEPSIEGSLQAVVVGNADLSGAHYEYFLEDSRGTWTRLLFDEHPEWMRGHSGHEHLVLPGVEEIDTSGKLKLRVFGTLDGAAVHVSDIEVMSKPDANVASNAQELIAATPRKVAVILANFSNNTSQPITPAAARDLVFAGTQSSNAYFKEMSFGIRSLVGKLAPTGDVFGWYTIAASNNPCDYSAWGSAARAAAQSAGVDLTGYDHIIHYFPSSSACGWSGVGQVPGKYTWINGSGAQTISHELGHNFGSHHAASLTCTDSSGARVPISATCTSSEYGNPFDVMGRGYRHMTAFNKGRIGFLEPENTTTVSADGSFTVTPLEKKSTSTQSLRIPINSTTAYYVEFRQPFGFDNFSATSSVVNGVLITRAPIAYTTLDRPLLLDMVPSTTSFTDAALTVGKTFTDPTARISVTVNSVSATGAVVSVDMP
ncbi:MAG: hypothetical protein ACOY0T_16995 [Myxococcota bacterium]